MLTISENVKYNFTLKILNETGDGFFLQKVKLYLYTNSINLLKFLVAGFIFPSRDDESEYPDISTSNQKGILLFKENISYENCLNVWKDELNVPVCIEIHLPDNLDGGKLIDKEYLGKNGTPDQLHDNHIAYFVPGCIPLSVVTSINFNDSRHLDNILNKKNTFKDLNIDLIRTKISPESFGKVSYNQITLNALINTFQFPEEIFTANNVDYLKKILAFLFSSFDFARDTSNPLVFLNFIKLLVLLPGKDVKEIRKRYKLLKDAGVDYADFNFSNHFYLLFPLIGSRYLGGNINEQFEKFISDFFGKKPEPDELIKLFLNFAIFSLIMSSRGDSSEIKSKLFPALQELFILQIKTTKKLTKKISEKYLSIFKLGEEINEYSKEIDIIKDWQNELNPIKYILLLGFNDDYERIRDLIKDEEKYGMDEIDMFKLTSYSALFSGTENMHKKYKRLETVFSCADRILINQFNCGLRYDDRNFIPEFKEFESDRLKIVTLKGLGDLVIDIEQKAEENKLINLIKKYGLPSNPDIINELAGKLGIENAITTEITFKGADLEYQLKEQSLENKRILTINFNKKPESINYQINKKLLVELITDKKKLPLINQLEKEFLERFERSLNIEKSN